MISASGLTLWRGFRCLFEQLSFELATGEALLIRGPNGSGKTTLLRVLCGLTRPEAGQVHWAGEPIQAQRETFTRALAYLGHRTGLKADLSPEQNLQFAARLRGQRANLDGALAAVGLAEQADLPVRHLSAGQQRRTALARLLQSNAKLWIMDEPLANLDAAGRDFVVSSLNNHLAAGGLAVLAVHEPLELARPCQSLTLGGNP